MEDAVARACRLSAFDSIRFSSRVLRYDSRPLLIGRRLEVEQCVS
jgi:hypothetical protein